MGARGVFMSTTVDLTCDKCGYEASFIDENSPIEEVMVLYFQGGWNIGTTTTCPDCSKVATHG